MKPFQSLSEYESLIYALQQSCPSITRSTMVVARRGRGMAILTGELHFPGGYRLSIYEILTWDKGPVVIQQ